MPLEQVLSVDPQRQWLSLEDLVDALLADAIAADARFQLTQAAAWQRFANELNQQGAALGSSDLAAGWGRQANLGLNQLSLELKVELYRPPWWRRLWGWLMALFGKEMKVRPARYRLARGNARGFVMQLSLVVSRGDDGRWRPNLQSAAGESL